MLPPMPEAELAALAEDIKTNGQHHPAIITRDGQLLDGRHRQEACERLGRELKVVLWDGEDSGASATAYVLSVNFNRRHLTKSQKACLADDARPLFDLEAKARQKASGGDRKSVSADLREPIATKVKGKAAEKAAAAVGVSPRLVEQLKGLKARAAPAEICALAKATPK